VSRISQDGGGKQKAEHNEKKGYTPEDKKKTKERQAKGAEAGAGGKAEMEKQT